MKTNHIYQGDCLEILKTLPGESIDCCITSPPYWGLRDYGTAKWEGGDEKCEHKKNPSAFSEKALAKSTIGAAASTGHAQEGYKDICAKCGAKRIDSQLGLEKTPEEYVAKMVEVFSEVRRVLKKDGTCWLNLGDSYNTQPAGNKKPCGFQQKTNTGRENSLAQYGGKIEQRKIDGLKPKDLVGIPWRVAFALQADGWWLRQDIIWHKPNPMPESVQDRCTKSHEYVFLLAKSPKYYYDNEAIKEKSIDLESFTGRRFRSADRRRTGLVEQHLDKAIHKTYPKKNKRSVWRVNSAYNKEAHFATFPEKLIIPMIKAGCPKGGLVLDPFMGSGTTGLVARKLFRNYVGIELSKEYIKIAQRRLQQGVLF